MPEREGRKLVSAKSLFFFGLCTIATHAHRRGKKGEIFSKKPIFAQRGSCEKQETMDFFPPSLFFKKRVEQEYKDCYCLLRKKEEVNEEEREEETGKT